MLNHLYMPILTQLVILIINKNFESLCSDYGKMCQMNVYLRKFSMGAPPPSPLSPPTPPTRASPLDPAPTSACFAHHQDEIRIYALATSYGGKFSAAVWSMGGVLCITMTNLIMGAQCSSDISGLLSSFVGQ